MNKCARVFRVSYCVGERLPAPPRYFLNHWANGSVCMCWHLGSACNYRRSHSYLLCVVGVVKTLAKCRF